MTFTVPKHHDMDRLLLIASRRDLGDVHEQVLREAFAELAHLREHVRHVQGVCERERGLRMQMDVKRTYDDALINAVGEAIGKSTADAKLMRETLVTIVPAGEKMSVADLCKAALAATVEAVRVVAPPPPEGASPPKPAPNKTPRWEEAEKRISAAVDRGEDPDPTDMEIVLVERMAVENGALYPVRGTADLEDGVVVVRDAQGRVRGGCSPEVYDALTKLSPLEVTDDRPDVVKAAEGRIARSWLGWGHEDPVLRDLMIIDRCGELHGVGEAVVRFLDTIGERFPKVVLDPHVIAAARKLGADVDTVLDTAATAIAEPAK